MNVSLDDIKGSCSIDSLSKCITLILKMNREGWIKAVIDEKENLVTFHRQKSNYNDLEKMMNELVELQGKISQWKKLDHKLSLNDQFLTALIKHEMKY